MASTSGRNARWRVTRAGRAAGHCAGAPTGHSAAKPRTQEPPMTEDLPARIARLERRVEIEDLVARYTLHAAAADAEPLAATFAPDGTFHSSTGVIQGRPALVAFFREVLWPGATVPIAGPLHLTFDSPTTGRLRCLMATNFHNDRQGGFCGFYDDDLVKIGDEWLFASRKFTFYHRA